MQKKLNFFFLALFLFSFVSLAQYNSRSANENIRNIPVSHIPSEAVLFTDDMNGDNTVAGLEARGWTVLNEDGGGTTAPFYQGTIAVFPAYEGPDTGYVAANYNGANGFLIDQWLISPEITVTAGDTLSFWHRSIDANPFDDSIYVKLSTTAGITPADFDVTWGRYLVSEAGWSKWVGVFPTSGTVRFAVQYYIVDGGPSGNNSNFIGLDLFEVVSPIEPIDFWIEDFDYPAGDTLTNYGWTAHSGVGTNPITINTFGLDFPGYPSSGIGLAALMDNTGEDVNKLFPSTTSGSVYASFMLRVDAAPTGYFFHFTPNPHNTFDFRGRVWLKSNGTGSFAVGYSYASSDTVFTTFDYSLGDTLLLVSKYEVIAGALNDVVSLYIFDNSAPAPLSEPITPTIGPIINTTTSADIDPGSISLRQYNAGQNIIIDGIRLGTVWTSIIPVELTSFAASVNGTSVNLNWSTATELNNSGFEIERKSTSSSWTKIGFVAGNGTTSEVKNYSYSDNSLGTGNYSYRLKQVDFDGAFEYSKVIEVEIVTPNNFELSQNYPNPFNPTTSIKFNIPEAGNVKLGVYNLLGQEVKSLVNGFRTAGAYTVNFDASNLSSGIYLYKIEMNNFTQVRKMTLLK